MHWRELPYSTRRAITLRLCIRDRWRCCLCGLPIVRLRDASVEHHRAQSFGGGHSDANLGAAHRSCNYARGNREVTGAIHDGRSFF